MQPYPASLNSVPADVSQAGVKSETARHAPAFVRRRKSCCTIAVKCRKLTSKSSSATERSAHRYPGGTCARDTAFHVQHVAIATLNRRDCRCVQNSLIRVAKVGLSRVRVRSSTAQATGRDHAWSVAAATDLFQTSMCLLRAVLNSGNRRFASVLWWFDLQLG